MATRSTPQRSFGVLTVGEAIAAGVLTLDAHSYGAPIVVRYRGDTAKVHIGRYCSLADGVRFVVGGNHRPDWVTTYPLRVRLGLPGALADGHPATKGDIDVGNDVWIGADARVFSGVKIGDGAVIGANTVVAANVRPYAVFAGNPGREIRRRFTDEIVEGLQRIAWWNWPEKLIRERVDLLCNSDADAFVQLYDNER